MVEHRTQHRGILLTAVTVFSICVLHAEGRAIAKGRYAMDKGSDCIATGYLDVPQGQTTYVQGQSYENPTGTQSLGCRLMFRPEMRGDILSVNLERGAYINSCDVTLEIDMKNVQQSNGNLVSRGPDGRPLNDGKYVLGCRSDLNSFTTLEAQDGEVSLWLSKDTHDAKDFYFQIAVRASKAAVSPPPPSDASDANVGMIVGIVVGVIILIIILIVVCVCCRRKRQRDQREKTAGDLYKKNISGDTLATSIYDEKSLKNGQTPSQSPGSERRLLNKDYDDSGKPRSALERFGPTPSRRGPSRQDDERDLGRKRDDYQPTEFGTRDERGEGRARENAQGRSPPRSPLMADLQSNAKFRRSFHESQAEPERASPPNNSVLAALHNNPKFRKSFRENEADADDRVRRISDYNSSSVSSGSLDATGSTKPKLPPVPKSPPRSPSPQRRGEKIASIHRGRPSSSSSEITKFDESETESLRNQGKKNDTRHTLRPNRGEKKPAERRPRDERRRDYRSEDSDDEWRERNRKDEERNRRRRQREREEEEERERRREEEKKQKRREEEKRRREEEEIEREKDREREGRFKKSASGRRSKGKGQKMTRSWSTGNALEEGEPSRHRTRSKSPSSVRSLNLQEDDDDDDLDSNYMPFRRAGSKTSLYASRSSLYGRKRKNSMGETMSMSSYAYDDVDSRVGDFDRSSLSHRDKERMFKSTGDLEMGMASATVVRECATWTGSDKGVYVYGRKTLAKVRHGKRYSRGTQTLRGRERRDSTGSTKSGRSTRSNQRLKSKSKSQESLRKEKRSRSREFSDDDLESERSRRRGRSKSRDRDYSEDESLKRSHRSRSRDLDDDESDLHSSRGKSKPKPLPRKSAGAASVDYSGSEGEDDARSAATSSMAPSSIYPPSQHLQYQPQFYPGGYPAVYPQGTAPYIPPGAPGGPPMMVPVAMPQQAKPPVAPKPSTGPKPSSSKWDQLVNLTDGMKRRRHQMGESVTETADTESVMSSMWSHPAPPQVYYTPPSYNTAQKLPDPNSTYNSSYLDSAHGLQIRQKGVNIDYSSTYAPSESNI